MTIIYLMRHSEPLVPEIINNSETLQIQNEKRVLTSNGEEIAKEKSNIEELKDFDIVISSHYTRTLSTAKYFTNDKVYIDERFGERKFGINSWDEKPKDFEQKQFDDFNYKTGDGESLNEVVKREEEALTEILDKYKDKKILIVGHATATAALLTKWCDINWGSYKFNNREFFNGNWSYCETFKLVFDENNNLISIENI